MNIIIKLFIIFFIYMVVIGMYTGAYFYLKDNFSLSIKDFNNQPTRVSITIIDAFTFSCSMFSTVGHSELYMEPITSLGKIIIASQQILTLLVTIFGISFVVGDCDKKMKIDSENVRDMKKISYMNKVNQENLNFDLLNKSNNIYSYPNINSIPNQMNIPINNQYKLVPINY